MSFTHCVLDRFKSGLPTGGSGHLFQGCCDLLDVNRQDKGLGVISGPLLSDLDAVCGGKV